jgi:hypothetical protein
MRQIVTIRHVSLTDRDRHTGLMGTTTPASPSVVWVGPSDHELIEGAIALGDQNNKTLGSMPHEVYKKAAAVGDARGGFLPTPSELPLRNPKNAGQPCKRT